MQRLQTLIPMSNAELMFTSAFVVALGITILVLVVHLRSPRIDGLDGSHELSITEIGSASIQFNPSNEFYGNPHVKARNGKDLMSAPSVGDLHRFR